MTASNAVSNEAATGREIVATRLFDTEVGRIRAFRMYYGPLL